MNFDHEKYEELLSSYHKFWMNVKYNVGLAPNWKNAPRAEDRCSDGFSTNQELFDSKECKKERLTTLTTKIDSGWNIQDVMQFIVLLFLPPISVLFTWGWCGNNVLNTCAAAVRGRYLEQIFYSAYDNPTRQKKVQDIIDQCGTMFLSTDIALDLPFWYSVQTPPSECLNRESVQITHIKDTNVSSNHAFEPKNRNAWLTCMNTRFDGALTCLQSNTAGSTKPTRNLIKNGEFCPPNTTYYINNQLRHFWLRATEIANYGSMPGGAKKYGYYANYGSEVPGEPVGIFQYLSFWYIQYLVAPLMAFKMSLINNIYELFGNCGEDVRYMHEQANLHGNETPGDISVNKILEDQKKVGGASFGISSFGGKFGKETIAFIFTPIFPYLFSFVGIIESFYMFVLVIGSFVSNACGHIWPLTSGAFMEPIDRIFNFLNREALYASERQTSTWWRFFASIARSLGGIFSLIFAIISAIAITFLFLIVGVIICSVFGPFLTSFISILIYFIGPIIGGDSWCSSVTGHFLNITGISGDNFHPWLFITKYKWLLFMVSIVSILNSHAVRVVLDDNIIGIAWGLLILSVLSPTVRRWIGITTDDNTKSTPSSKNASASSSTSSSTSGSGSGSSSSNKSNTNNTKAK